MKADKILSEKGIDYQLISQDKPTKACHEAAEERGVDTSQIVKSLIVRKNDEIIHVCIPGDRKLSEKKFGSYRLVKPEKSKEITGFDSGTVHPLSSDLKHVVDERIFEIDKISFTTGSKVEGVILDARDFSRAISDKEFELEVRDLVVTEERDLEELKQLGIDEDIAEFLTSRGYRSILLDLKEDFDNSRIVDAVRKLHREKMDFGAKEVRKLLERAENENHMQKMAEKLNENGKLPEESGFELEKVIEEVLQNNQDAVNDFQEGKDSALNYFIGKIMESTNGKADAGKARKKIQDMIGHD
jgi:prolyl-tRNA editing enzyme YbaK/EbsC (Cys-tRNA(Pro) deacylase)